MRTEVPLLLFLAFTIFIIFESTVITQALKKEFILKIIEEWNHKASLSENTKHK